MANDKDFVVAGAVEVGKDTKVTLGTVTSNDIDLATGNYFADTPTGASTYTISNAGDVQSFQLEVTGGTAEVAQNFSTTLYTGNDATQTITNNIDLSGDGGLVWIKQRDGSTQRHILYDTERGTSKTLATDRTDAEFTSTTRVTSFNSDGFDLGSSSQVNGDPHNYVSWSFKKEPSFFDVVTYTGDGVAGKTVSHNLGADVGTLIVKKTNSADNWFVWHRGLTDATYRIMLNSTSAETQQTNAWNSTAPTSTEFTLGDNGNTNASGDTYVAYLFAHDDAADGLIQCGSYTGNGTSGNAVTLGWKPQFIIIKSSTGIRNWIMFDSARGMTTGNDPYLLPNTTGVEGTTTDWLDATATGFELQAENIVNASGETFIYVAIRAASDLDITWPSSIEWTGGSAPSSPATGETDVFTLSTDDGGTTYTGIKSIDNAS